MLNKTLNSTKKQYKITVNVYFVDMRLASNKNKSGSNCWIHPMRINNTYY